MIGKIYSNWVMVYIYIIHYDSIGVNDTYLCPTPYQIILIF